MVMRRCCRCKNELDIDKFHLNQSMCKVCRKLDDQWRYQNTDKRAKMDHLKADIVAGVNAHKKSCAFDDCNETHTCVLEFHHVRGEKKDEISDMVTKGFSLAKIEIEIAKCVVICSNCHRKIHAGVKRLPPHAL